MRAVDGKGWIQLGLFGLYLYVPNYPHDPALRPMIERKMFNEEKQSLLQALNSLKQFQEEFTGQESSFRIRQVEQAIQQMGEEPPLPAIVRPAVSELDNLHGEFSNLLSIIQPVTNGSMSIEEAIHDSTLQQNVFRIIQRLKEGYRAYEDITDTVIGFLVCISLGLALGRNEEENKAQDDISKTLRRVCHDTPFLGRRRSIEKSEWFLRDLEQGLAQHDHVIDVPRHALFSLTILKSIDPASMSKPAARSLLHDLFTNLYSDWKTKLLQEQEKEAQNSSLYTYRGIEDEEDEDPTLFPDYEAEHEESQSALAAATQSRDHAIRLANMHADLFIHGREASDSIKIMLEWCTAEMNRVSGGKGHGIKHDDFLPAIYLALEKKADALSLSGTGTLYNFYFDANLPEAKRLITLIYRVQIRYRQIRNIWPEHTTLSDVLRTCDETLEFRHVDPVAKFITKAEKLHAYMYEWQKVASNEYSTANLYNDLTALLISWRKLELTTWARLFDLETDKCRDDAKSWFFVAYETIIAASDSIDDGGCVKAHAKDLLKSLESFFETTTLGQFGQRLKLLRQLRQHAAMRISISGVFKTVHAALDNVIDHFSHFEKPVQDALTKGRHILEKEVKDVIKLASWKDTNIEALKQSAKTSHRKLSKLVRRFRGLLNQSVVGIIKSGFPDENYLVQNITMSIVEISVDPNTLARCASNVLGWTLLPTRFKNLGVTVSTMRSLSVPKHDTINGTSYINEFVSELALSITELQKGTPSTLTDENKESVQHLKTQKRKLYADTMKELRQMGVNANLSIDSLAKQDELSTVLSTLPLVHGDEQSRRTAKYNLHKALNLMPQVRAVYKEHSGDLTTNDVARSIGYLEGLLYISIRQRGVLSRATKSFERIKAPMTLVLNLCQCAGGQILRVTEQQLEIFQSLQPSLHWLTAMLKTGTDIVSVQAKLGKTNELDALVQSMRELTIKLQNLADSYDRLPTLPINIQSEAYGNWDEAVKITLSDVQIVFKDWMDNNDIARTVLRQIQPFLFNYPEVKIISHPEEAQILLENYVKDIFSAMDLILGTMQDVEAVLKGLPASAEDAAWLVKEEQTLSAALNALHSSQISNALQILLDSIQHLQENTDFRDVGALFASVRPILDQYVASHVYLLDRFDTLHASTANLLHRLSKSFIQIGTQGFCQPPEKSTDEQKGKDDKLESGTGLGEGEGAEDISKDIEDDEDLEDLAQEKKDEREGSIKEEDDAIDMGEQEMEGETEEVGEKEDKGDESGEEGDDDVQSEVGSVDDLGPSAVDEKIWDQGAEDDNAKDKEGTQNVGTENQDEQIAAEQEQKEKEKNEENGNDENKQDDQEEDAEMEGEDQEENVGTGETEKMDPYAKEEETLELPEDLNMDGQDDEGKDDDLGDMDMGDDSPKDEVDPDIESGAPDFVDKEIGNEKDGEEKNETTGHIEDEEQLDEDLEEGIEEPQDENAVALPDDNMPDDEIRDTKDTDQRDPNAEAGAGTEANEEVHKDKTKQVTTSATNQDEGQEGDASDQKRETMAEDGKVGQTAQPDAGGRGEQPEDSQKSQSFKKLGDVLEKWYNRQKQISEAREKDETQTQQIDKEIDMADADFEHLGDEDMQADTQALGTATEEQARSLDHDMAIPVSEDEEKMPARSEDHDDQADADKDISMQDAEMEQAHEQNEEQQQSRATETQAQAFIGEQKPHFNEDQEMEDAMSFEDNASETSSFHEVETQLELTHLDVSTMTSDTARSLWLSHEAATHSLSQQLTEHLRLILAPTLATKLRGDFRTGKRLNLKRIIPYIASGYKRDKIWLRRSQPSKRSYQVMIALDDSKSMAESGASNLALKTLTLVTKSLSMLEVGEVSVVGFGDNVNVAHDFDKPFTSEAGVRVFEQFGFDAVKTNVRGLVDNSLDLFAEARRKASTSVAEDLWQLMLIVSDGICDSHTEIQRLVRKAQEQRVMIVFIIVDATATTPPSSNPTAPSTDSAVPLDSSAKDQQMNREKTSILDLQSVEITPEGKVVRWKYMERFPFRYYLVVRDVRELPGVLAGALRQWFGEVAGSA